MIARQRRLRARFAFTRDVGEASGGLSPIVATGARALTHDEREEQLIRRGRYVEFNLPTTAAPPSLRPAAMWSRS